MTDITYNLAALLICTLTIAYVIYFALRMRTELKETNELIEQLQKTVQEKEQFVDKSLNNLESSQSRLSKLVAKLEHAQARLFWYQEKYDRAKDPETGKFKRRNNG
jgi:uncharacterized protein HemX